MPPSTAIPVVAYPDVGEAVDWLCETFGFTERWRAGNHRAQLAVGDGAVVVTERGDDQAPSSADHSVMVRVDDVSAHHKRARIRRPDPAPSDRLPVWGTAVHVRGSRRPLQSRDYP